MVGSKQVLKGWESVFTLSAGWTKRRPPNGERKMDHNEIRIGLYQQTHAAMLFCR
jgi:hypothetical protein